MVIEKSAQFSPDKTHRFYLLRVWDKSLPMAMFIGLNPSTADGEEDDRTIESVIRLAKFNGYGGFYMMNCWSYISTDPNKLDTLLPDNENTVFLRAISQECKDVIFAWGNFKVVVSHGKDKQLEEMFPNAMCITKNKNGSPGHPLYKKGTIKFISWK